MRLPHYERDIPIGERPPLAPSSLLTGLGGLVFGTTTPLIDSELYIQDAHTLTPRDASEYYRPTAMEIEEQRGSTLVDMGMDGFKVAPVSEAARLFTVGLGGCTAIAFTTHESSGARLAYLKHADPFQMTFHNRGGVNMPGTSARTGKAVIMTPGYGQPILGQELGAALDQLQQPSEVAAIARILGQTVGTANVMIVPYTTANPKGSSPYSNTLIVDIPVQGEGTILADGRYKV